MFRRSMIALLLAGSLLAGVACKKRQQTNPLAQLNSSKQPDKVLLDRARQAMKQHKYETARMTLQTLISAYPDSEYVAQAKLAVGECWYEEGTPAALAQAESEFRDFITFFPNMPEAAEAQMKIANIHYRQMGKPDRDFTHALRAQDEYRQLLLQYPDSKWADIARIRLLQVQEVLAEREFRIERFYFERGALLASIARGETLVERYPLYSRADEALYLLGQAYEQEAQRTELSTLAAPVKKKLTAEYLDRAAADYDKILTRYPELPREKDARQRLEAMKRPAPVPPPEAIALNKREVASRTRTTAYERFVTGMSRHPDLSEATQVGQPSLSDSKEVDASELAREITETETEMAAAKGGVAHPASGPAVAANQTPQSANSNDPKVDPTDIPKEAPPQLNEAAPAGGESASGSSSAASEAPNRNDDLKHASSSHKPKKKHHFHVPLPF